MDVERIREKIKEIIAEVTSIDPQEIGDQDSFADLQLDSLSLLQIGVDVDSAFRLGVAEQRLEQLATVQDAVDLVVECLDGGIRAQVA